MSFTVRKGITVGEGQGWGGGCFYVAGYTLFIPPDRVMWVIAL